MNGDFWMRVAMGLVVLLLTAAAMGVLWMIGAVIVWNGGWRALWYAVGGFLLLIPVCYLIGSRLDP